MHSTFSAMTNDDQCSMQVDSDEDEGEEGRERGEREEREGSKEPAAEVVLVELASDGNNTTGTQKITPEHDQPLDGKKDIEFSSLLCQHCKVSCY